MNREEIDKIAEVYETILSCESKNKNIEIKETTLIQEVLNNSKKHKVKLNKKEVQLILNHLLVLGRIFHPKQGIIQRIANQKR